MSVLKYDTVNSAYKDIQAMQRYDSSANAWKDCTSAQVQENGVWTEKFKRTALNGVSVTGASYYESGDDAGKMYISGTYTSDITSLVIGGVNATLNSNGTFYCYPIPTDNNSPQFTFEAYTNKSNGIVILPFFTVEASASGSGGYTGRTGSQTVTYTPKIYCGITYVEVQASVNTFMQWDGGVVANGSVSTSTGYFSFSATSNTRSPDGKESNTIVSSIKGGTVSQFGTFTIVSNVTKNMSNWIGATGISVKYYNPDC